MLDGLLELDRIGLEVLLLSAELAHTRGNDLTFSRPPASVAHMFEDGGTAGVMRFDESVDDRRRPSPRSNDEQRPPPFEG